MPPDTVKITRVATLADLAERRDQWNALATHATVFQTYEWHSAWWSVFGDESEPLLLVAERDSKLVGIAPLLIEQTEMFGPRRAVGFIGEGHADYRDFIYESGDRGVVEAFVDWLVDHEDLWDVVLLKEVPESSTRDLLPEICSARDMPARTLGMMPAPTRILGTPVTERLARRKQAWLERNGSLEHRRIETSDAMRAHLPSFFAQHVARRAATPEPSIFTDEKNKRFFKAIVEHIPEAWPTFDVLFFDGRPAAYHFGFEYAARFLYYYPTFDIALGRRSPGLVLLHLLLERARVEGLREFDFSIGDEAYKDKYATLVRTNAAIAFPIG